MCLHSHQKQHNQRIGEKFFNLSLVSMPWLYFLSLSAIPLIHHVNTFLVETLIRDKGLKTVEPIQLQSEPWCLLLIFPNRSRLWWWYWWVSMLPLVHVICSLVENPIIMSLRLDVTIPIDLGHRREGGPHFLAQEFRTQSVEGAEDRIHDCLFLKRSWYPKWVLRERERERELRN